MHRREAKHSRRFGSAVVAFCLFAAGGPVAADMKPTFSIDYIVSVTDKHPGIATIRWELAGIDEVQEFELHFPADRFGHFQGSGKLERLVNGLRWTPGGPFAHLTYSAKLDHVRGQHQRYDSHAAPSWVVTRSRALFPRISIHFRPSDAPAKSRARLIFRLPAGWRSAAAFPAIAENTYQLTQPGKVLDRPRGWFALGKFELQRQEIGGIMIQVARLPGSALAPQDLFQFLESTFPRLQALLVPTLDNILIVSAPDPMWHGGISGERSFYIHGNRPLRTPDKTSPYLHELFHVLQPYKPGPDADWIEEGLAEFYSLELQRRAGLIDAGAYARALGYFERYGLWDVDLTQQQDNAATNNSAPLVMYALDQHIQHATAGKQRLDDVVTQLAKQGGTVDTARFHRVIDKVSGKHFSKFFDRHVAHGVAPTFGMHNSAERLGQPRPN